MKSSFQYKLQSLEMLKCPVIRFNIMIKQKELMQIASTKDRKLVTDILTKAFADNKSVNYIISANGSRERRIRALVEYSFDVCNLFGKIYLS
ncbi:hypothetical protein ACFP1I_10525 [Dyadobacter subterraneus]|uniref:Uncharacterized protein n=1 Tax=Dyadobacter subterraneus TaxID=2773304 RepID=A0ABR9WBC6_9BACT|nr:hypothetical protein [Dyadobacter subterraneus]MBE9462459.1 hypothetical protein [Dyadobacter subterraneus]